MHMRSQGWNPSVVRSYIDGREWVARQLAKAGVGCRRYENTLPGIDAVPEGAGSCAIASRILAWLRVHTACANDAQPAQGLHRLAGLPRFRVGDWTRPRRSPGLRHSRRGKRCLVRP